MTETRSSNRYPVSLDVTLKLGDRTIEATCKNLSLGGMAVVLEERLAHGTRLRLAFRIPNLATAIEVDGEVRWSTDSETGLQFGGLRAREVWELNRFFESLARSR